MELSSHDIIYNFDFDNNDLRLEKLSLLEYVEEVYDNIRTAIDIDEEGYNVYLIDDFSKTKLEDLKDYINEILKYRDNPKDICYVIKENANVPYALYVPSGKGNYLKGLIEELQESYYKIIYNFYNGSSCKEKEDILEKIKEKRSDLITDLMNNAHECGFEIRSTSKGFTFIPVKNGEIMTEKEYDSLNADEKEEILKNVSGLKDESEKILEVLKDVELKENENIKEVFRDYLLNEASSLREKYKIDFLSDLDIIKFLDEMCEEIEEDIIDNYSMNYEDDEEKINEIIVRYDVNVLVDNSDNLWPQVIYEENPNVINLLGSIEYKNQNGTYVTDMSLIKSGSMLRANEGCLILRAGSLLTNPTAYHNLKKAMMSGKVDFNYNRGYVELMSISSLDPEPIKIKVKIIMIGDYETYDALYNYDEDFRKLFKIKAQYNPVASLNDNTKTIFVNNILSICKKNKLKPLEQDAIKEVAKFLSRKVEDKNKILIDSEEISKILMISNNNAVRNKRDSISRKDIIDVVYKEDQIEKSIREYYEENKILLDVSSEKAGQINGLSVIDAGYYSFGKPIRITCSCYKGEGQIIDVQKQSDLSGNIHSKAVNILKGLISELFGKYSRLPVNFHLSFEQIYGKIEGDSASVAELVAMLSSVSNIPIKQNIAVTGSINQFGEVQPIGGVNEKIEGFFKICRGMGGVQEKGVLIPYSNRNDLILNEEVEAAIKEGKFHIYTMKTMKDAVNILMKDYDEVLDSAKQELIKYEGKE